MVPVNLGLGVRYHDLGSLTPSTIPINSCKVQRQNLNPSDTINACEIEYYKECLWKWHKE